MLIFRASTAVICAALAAASVDFAASRAAAAPRLLAAPAAQLAQKTDKKKSSQADRATALRLSELMPAPIEGWKSAKPRISWISGGVSSRTKYWAAEGRERFTIVYETRSRGLLYKQDLLNDAKLAKRRGYEIKEIEGQKALVRATRSKKEIRIWLDDKVLVLAIGPAKLETIEEHLKAVDFKKVGAVK